MWIIPVRRLRRVGCALCSPFSVLLFILTLHGGKHSRDVAMVFFCDTDVFIVFGKNYHRHVLRPSDVTRKSFFSLLKFNFVPIKTVGILVPNVKIQFPRVTPLDLFISTLFRLRCNTRSARTRCCSCNQSDVHTELAAVEVTASIHIDVVVLSKCRPMIENKNRPGHQYVSVPKKTKKFQEI